MAGYDDTRQKILATLMQRPNGTEIQPTGHQDFALNLLDYVRSVELISGSTLIGVAYEDTVPVQSNDANGCYIAGIAQDRSMTFQNFRDMNGRPIIVTTGEMEGKLIILLWNRQYWSFQEIPTNITSASEKAYFYYNLTIRKTYASVAAMNADVTAPVANDGKLIKVGETVSVHNETTPAEDAIYSWEAGPKWQLQMKLSAIDSRVFDGGRADSKYGGARNINCGNAQG